MPIAINEITAHNKAFDIGIAASAAGVSVLGGPVLIGRLRYVVPAMEIPCAWNGDDTTYFVTLRRTQAGAEVALIEDDGTRDDAKVIDLAHWRLRESTDTCATVAVHRARCALVQTVDADDNPVILPDPTVISVSSTPVLPDASPTGTRVMSRKRRARIRDLRQQAVALREAGTTYSAMTAAQRQIIQELVALTGEAAPLAVP